MSWLLLFALTALVVLLPMLPAWLEWRRPTDVSPLFIDKDDALDPPHLARSFMQAFDEALAHRHQRLGRSPIATLAPHEPWPFTERELVLRTTRRVWHVQGNVEMPEGMSFLGEVAARQSLRAAPDGVYRALWVQRHLLLPAGCTLLRWAHATRVDVGPDADLAGRVSADEAIHIAPGVRFTLLHAPVVRFAPGHQPPPVLHHALTDGEPRGLPESVVWHEASATGRCSGPLEIPPGSAWQGDLVCAGDVLLGAGCQVDGSLKANGRLTLEPGCRVAGSVVARGEIALKADVVVGGPLVSETAITLSERCVAGTLHRPCSVTAPLIAISAGVVVHGTVWAGDEGVCDAVGPLFPPPAMAAPERRLAAHLAEALT